MKPALVILAAGLGRRFGRCKQREPVGPGGESLMEYAIYDALRAGFGSVVPIVSPDMELSFSALLRSCIGDRAPVHPVVQRIDDLPSGFEHLADARAKPWGTGHAVLAARSVVTGPFAVINADDFYGRDAIESIGAMFQQNNAHPTPTFALAGYLLRHTLSDSGAVSRAICEHDEHHMLQRITEVLDIERAGEDGRHPDATGTMHSIPGDTIVSMNLWGLTPAVFDLLDAGFRQFLDEQEHDVGACAGGTGEFYLPHAIQNAITAGRAQVRIVPAASQWFGMTFAEDRDHVRAQLESLVEQGVYPRKLWA